jgi:hypothetical protein
MVTLLLDALVTHSLACRRRRRIRGKAEHVALWRHGDLAARPTVRRERELGRFRLHLLRHRTVLKNRIHATLITFGHPCPVSDLSGWPAASCSTALRSPTRGGAASTSASG